jgi:predicted porin
MQKKVLPLALALLCGAPLASHAVDFKVGATTNLNISGLVAVGLKDAEVTNTTRNVKDETRVDDNTSRIIFSGNTELGQGLKAVFRIETRYTNDTRPSTPLVPGSTTSTVSTGTGWADGDTWGGLQGAFGTIVFGKSAIYYTDTLQATAVGLKGAGETYRIWDVNGLAVYNILGEVGTKGANFQTLGLTRSQNVIRWDSPAFNGFDASVAYTKNPSGDENKFGCAGCAADYESGGTWYGRVRYNNGPLSASLSVLNSKVQGSVVTAPYLGPLDKTAYRVGAAYTFDNGLRIGGVYDNTKVDNGIPGTTSEAKRGAWSIPLSYNFGDHAVYVTYSRANDTSGLADSGAKQINVGWDYMFAKNTYVGLFYTNFKNGANGSYTPYLTNTALGATSPRTGEGFRQFSLDLNYWF